MISEETSKTKGDQTIPFTEQKVTNTSSGVNLNMHLEVKGSDLRITLDRPYGKRTESDNVHQSNVTWEVGKLVVVNAILKRMFMETIRVHLTI